MGSSGKVENARASMLLNPNAHYASLLAPKMFYYMQLARVMHPARMNRIERTECRLHVACTGKDRAFGGFHLVGTLLAPGHTFSQAKRSSTQMWGLTLYKKLHDLHKQQTIVCICCAFGRLWNRTCNIIFDREG